MKKKRFKFEKYSCSIANWYQMSKTALYVDVTSYGEKEK